MKKATIALGVVTLVFGMMTGSVFAFGVDITIPDGNTDNDAGYWVKDWHAKSTEDQEVEPGMETGQKWDLEGFFQNGTKVTMIGGYNFKSGEGGWNSGDIFIDVDGDAKYGDIHDAQGNTTPVANKYGYDFVLDLNDALDSYNIYKITDTSQVYNAFYAQNQGSSPWRYASGGTLIGSRSMTYQTGLSDATTGFLGGNHNAVTVDLGFLTNLAWPKQLAPAFTLHYTMGCGNDNLMGAYAPVPEPSTVLLIGAGLLGLIGVSRKHIGKK